MNGEPKSVGTTQVLLCTNWNKDIGVSHLGVGTGSAQQGMSLGLGQPDPPSSPRKATSRMGQVGHGWVPLVLGLASPKSWAGRAGSAGQGCLRGHRISRSRPGEQKVSALLPKRNSSWSPLSLVKQLELHDPREKWNWDMGVVWGRGPTQTCTVTLRSKGAQQSQNILLSKLE